MRNIFITFLSAVFEDPKNPKTEKVYESDSAVHITGKYTNDAPAKYFLHKPGKMDMILCLVTTEAKDSFDKFTAMIREECAAYSLNMPEIKEIEYLDTAEGINRSIDEITGYTESGDHIYLDITGGFRHANYMIMLMMKFADFTNKRITVDQVIYSSLHPEKINDITDIYKLFDLMNGAQNFMQFGSSEQLYGYFQSTVNPDRRIMALIECMQDFSEAVTLCKTRKLDNILSNMNELIEKISEIDNNDDKGTMFFKKIADVIKERFSVTENGKISYPGIIKWCVQNNMIQQALTVYVEKMPSYLINEETGIIKASPEARRRAVKNKGVYDEDYKLFFEGFMLAGDSDDSYVKTVSSFIKNNSSLIVECMSSDEFAEKYKGEELPVHFTELLDAVYTVRKCTYIENGGRYPDDIIKENYRGNENLAKVIGTIESNPGSFNKFINILASNKNLLKVLHSKYLISSYAHNEAEPDESRRQKHSPLKKVYTALNIKTILAASGDYSLQYVQEDAMGKFMLDYLYIKQYLRNTINHAADESSLGAETLDALRELGYKIESDTDEIKIKYIKELVSTSLDRLIRN